MKRFSLVVGVSLVWCCLLVGAIQELPAPVTVEDIEKLFEQDSSVRSVEAFLERLPLEMRSNFVLMTQSESAQPASAAAPRVILQSRNSQSVLAFSTERDGSGNYTESFH